LPSNPVVCPDFAFVAFGAAVATAFSFIGCEKDRFERPATVKHSALPEDGY
jgi:hypothetical protein